MPDDDLPFRIDEWDGPKHNRIVETIARVGNLYVARAAFAEAARLWPKKHLTLRHGARVIMQWPPR